MNQRDRFTSVLNFKTPDDRLPMVEWAGWWDLTHHRWQREGLPGNLRGEDLVDYFGIDELACIKAYGISDQCPKPAYHGAPVITDEASYDAVRPYILNDSLIGQAREQALQLKEKHESGEIAVRLWLDGFFWFPRSMFGIMNHLFAFYEFPALMHRMNNDLAEFDLRVMETVFQILEPDMVGFAEDMSYNHGSMISHDMYREFLSPYYAKTIPFIKKHGIKVMVDSDGDITQMIPWLLEDGIEGVYPLERQAGVDVAALRRQYPKLLILGAYDKLVMSKGEQEMRAEFERLLPVMRSGGFVPSVDHQTPPEVSLDNYRIYLRLFEEYCTKAVR
ncbi:MAG: hypothetical protein FWF29_01440 [Treponema sp.]|nr:hypothetical protein [Treponema sp.]